METLIPSLYKLTSFEYVESVIKAEIHLDKEHDIFKGHFPGNPIMPGVCMIQIIKELTEKAIEKPLFLSRSSNIKFMAIINPEKDPDIGLTIEIGQEADMVKIKAVANAKDVIALKMSADFKFIED